MDKHTAYTFARHVRRTYRATITHCPYGYNSIFNHRIVGDRHPDCEDCSIHHESDCWWLCLSKAAKHDWNSWKPSTRKL